MPGFYLYQDTLPKSGEGRYIEKVSKTINSILYILCILFDILLLTGKEDSVSMDPFDPVFALWFLLTLFFFHVILVIVKEYKSYIVLPIAIIVSLFAGYSDDINTYLSFQEQLCSSQFSIWATYLNLNILNYLEIKIYTNSVTCIGGFFTIYYLHPINSDWLLGDSPYISLEGKQDLYSPVKRLLLYFVILITMFSF